MTKRIIAIIFALALFVGLSVGSLAAEMGEESFVYDQANLLSSYEESELADTLREISHANGVQVVVATVDSTDGKSADAYVNYFYDSMDLGYGTSRDGILLLVSMSNRQYRILSNGSAADVITPSAIDEISDSIVSYLSDGDYAEAFLEFADECDSYYRFDIGEHLIPALIIGAVVGVIVALILKAQLKSVRKRYTAHEYVRAGSMNISKSADLFLYRTVNRTARQKSSSSGSGRSSGGSRNVGGGSF